MYNGYNGELMVACLLGNVPMKFATSVQRAQYAICSLQCREHWAM